MLFDKHSIENLLKMFFFVLSTVDHKESINQYMNNINLSPDNYRYENFKDFSPLQEEFCTHHLDLKSDCKRDITVEIMLKCS